MADTPKPGETVAPSKNDGNNQGTPTPTAVPTVTVQEPVKADDNAVEQLKKELEQQKMRANQLENEKKAREEAEAKKKAEELEEQNQFKSLYEQEKTKREEIEREREAEEQKKELEKARSDVLKDYSDEVKALADEVGLDLTSADEAAVNSFKEKLDKINTRVANTGRVGPNNQQNQFGGEELSGDELREALQDENKFHEIMVKKFPGIAAMTNQRKST